MTFDAGVFRRRICRVGLFLGATTAGLWLTPQIGLGQDQTLSLSTLEHELINSPALAAADTRIFGAGQAVDLANARVTGFDYYFNNDLGPRSDIVIRTSTNRTFRYAQEFGVQFPLFGTRLAERLDLTQARSEVTLAQIQSQADRRTLLARLRTSYIKYWQSDREQTIIEKFVGLGKRETPSARAFLRTGFWTQANYLSFLDGINRFQTDLRVLRSARRSALADLRAVVNSDIPESTPQNPDFSLSCSPTVDDAVTIAIENDPEIARLKEQQDEARASLEFVRRSTLEANFRVGAGTRVDFPQDVVGYNVTAAFGISFPQHGKSEESAKRAGIYATLQTSHFLELQRRSDIRAEVLNALDESNAARDEYQQAKHEKITADEVLREARVREANVTATGAASFAEVQSRILDSYTAERLETTDLGAIFTRINELEAKVPNTCLPFRIDGPLDTP